VSESWQILVYESQRLVYSMECPAPVELGRQGEGDDRPYSGRRVADCWRLVLAPVAEEGTSRKHVRAEPLPDGRVRLINKSKKLPVRFLDGSELPQTCSRDLALPVALHLGQRVVRIEAPGPGTELRTLPEATRAPGAGRGTRSLGTVVGPAMSGEEMLRWVEAAMDVLQSAANSLNFFKQAADALVTLVGLDTGLVVLRERDQWQERARTTAAHVPDPDRDREPSRQVLVTLLDKKRTIWQVPVVTADSLHRVSALVAAPILNPRGEVIGALYGDRVQQEEGGTMARGPISQMEAMLVELLATGVAAGLARWEQEQAALQSQTKLLQKERELGIARDLQAGFLPQQPLQVPGWEMKPHFCPAREVGGDFYDIFRLSETHLALVIADVCDKGVGAALFMTLVRSLLRAFAHQTLARRPLGWSGQSLAPLDQATSSRWATLLVDFTVLSTVDLTNSYVACTHSRDLMHTTLFFGVLDTATGSLTYVNAGHDPPVLLGAGGIKTRLAPTGPAVGDLPEAVYDLGKVLLEPGDVLFAYTDGVTEARDPSGGFFTETRLLALLDRAGVQGAADLLESVVAGVREFVAGAEPSDDVTMLAVRRTPPPS
jgi:sigma-B regulation protein RsbU (phosphoserine phosphatase)